MQMLVHQNRYFTQQPGGIGDAALSVLMVGGLALSMTWGYLGMLRILGSDRTRTRIVMALIVGVVVLSMIRVGAG
jgi:hypothetical protein